jgi:uncharacterized protein YutE (UPF0331/DUF86 family)
VTPSKLRQAVVADRVGWIRQMLEGLRALPLDTYQVFSSENRNVAAAESYLRRALEGLLDLGRHILAKGFGEAVPEYKQIWRELTTFEVLDREQGKRLRILAGYRNRMVHFYHEISDEELYRICSLDLSDIEDVLEVILQWIRNHPEKINDKL